MRCLSPLFLTISSVLALWAMDLIARASSGCRIEPNKTLGARSGASLIKRCASTSLRNLASKDNKESLRYLILGTSDSWGAGIPPGRTMSSRYSALLGSNHVYNAAERASGPTYPSLCLESIVQDQVFDVVIIEFMQLAKEGLEGLAKRVRQRFPQATIIFLDLWFPDLFSIKHGADGTAMRFYKWMMSKGVPRLHSEESLRIVEKGLRNPSIQVIPNPAMEQAIECQDLQRKVARDVKGYVWGLPFPSQESIKEDFIKGIKLFGDGRHLSEAGHYSVAHGLSRLVRTIPHGGTNDVAPWASRDQCSDWLTNPRHFSHQLGPGATIARFPHGKNALQIDQGGGSLVIENQFKTTNATLFLTYMSTSMEGLYPVTKAYINNPSNTGVELVPHFFAYERVHISKTQRVGKLSPGTNTIWLKPTEGSTKLPFRLIGTSIVEKEEALDVAFQSGFISGHQVMGFN